MTPPILTGIAKKVVSLGYEERPPYEEVILKLKCYFYHLMTGIELEIDAPDSPDAVSEM